MAIHRRLFSLLILFFPIQLGLHLWPSWSQVVGRRIDYLSPTIYLTDILLVFICIFWVADVWRKQATLRISPRIIISLVSSVSGIALINILFASNPSISIYKWLTCFEFILLGWYIADTKIHLNDFLIPLLIGASISSGIALLQFALQRSIGGPMWFLGERTFFIDTPGIARASICLWYKNGCHILLRPYATFPHPNVLGGFLAICLPFFLYHLHQMRSSPVVYLTLCGFVISILGLISSLSRSACVVGASLLMGMLFFLRKEKTDFGNLGTFLAVSASLLIGMCILVTLPRLTDESVVVRNQLNSAAIAMWQSSPFFGVGIGNYLVELPNFLPQRSGNFVQPVHNIYLLVLSELGLVGIMGVGMLLAVLMYVKKISGALPTDTHHEYLVTLSLLGLLAIGFVDHYPLTLHQGQLLFVLFASVFLSRFL